MVFFTSPKARLGCWGTPLGGASPTIPMIEGLWFDDSWKPCGSPGHGKLLEHLVQAMKIAKRVGRVKQLSQQKPNAKSVCFYYLHVISKKTISVISGNNANPKIALYRCDNHSQPQKSKMPLLAALPLDTIPVPIPPWSLALLLGDQQHARGEHRSFFRKARPEPAVVACSLVNDD